MNQVRRYQSYLLMSAAVLSLTTLLLATGRPSRARQAGETSEPQERPNQERYLFVWAGDQSRSNPDFLAVINFNEHSSHYGEVIQTVPLPGAEATGNEPHHVGLSRDGKVLATGGLLSLLKGQPGIFFFDVSDPDNTKFLSSANPTQSSITDDFHPLSDGGFLVTMMGGAQGHAPGRVVEFNDDLKIVAEHPKNPPQDGFNPHGIDVRPDRNLMVTSDFICPTSTLDAVAGGLDLRGSVRVWDKIHVAKVTDDDLVLDPRFQLDFNTAFKTGPARPHGLATK